MKQQKLMDYRPSYPRKALRSAALTGLALMAIGSAAGCRKAKLPELVTEGMVAITTEPPEEVLVTDGEVAIPEPTEEELLLDGEVAVCEPTPAPELTTTGMVYIPAATPER